MKNETLAWEIRFQNPRMTGGNVTDHKVTHASTVLVLRQWPDRAIRVPQKRDFLIETSAVFFRTSSSGGGLFGRPVILMDPGRFLFAASFFAANFLGHFCFPQAQAAFELVQAI